nr:hypothetical protein GCM10017547_10720 [Pseudarthrobacter oxydans]
MGEEVLVVDGGDDLWTVAAGGRQGVGGESCFDGADDAVELFLGAGATFKVRTRILGRVVPDSVLHGRTSVSACGGHDSVHCGATACVGLGLGACPAACLSFDACP